MAEVPWIRFLFGVRTLPEKFTNGKTGTRPGLSVDQITRAGSGFMILEEIPGREVVVGSVGRFWHLNIPFREVTPDKFRDFDTPGYGKLAWSISVEPFRDGSTIAIEVRTSATDASAWKKLNRYYHVIGPGSRLIRASVMRHLETSLGRMRLLDDNGAALPGDELIPEARHELTYSRNIEANISVVWRYLMQLGCDRAGWYSIDTLDNGGRASTDHLVEEWNSRNVDDRISATPRGDNFFKVYAVENKKHFVIGGEKERAGKPFRMTWAFVLEPVGEDATLLISRARMASSPRWKEWLMGKIAYPPVHGLMSHVQLDTIKKLAERDAGMRIGA